MTNHNYAKYNGLLNELFDYSELVPSGKYEFKAYCTSDECCIEGGRRLECSVARAVQPNVTECPYCGHALVWQKSRTSTKKLTPAI